MNRNNLVIAVDGYSSSGKSTMARQLAKRLGYRYIDSGAMYRAVTLYALRNGLIADDGCPDVEALARTIDSINIDFSVMPDGSQHTLLNGEDVESLIRSIEVSSHVSAVATIPAVRTALVRMQQSFGTQGGIVMDGRDIGTTVFPNADIKFFVNASAETRAMRRFEELRAKGDTSTTYEKVLDNIRTRDYTDTTRAESPLRKADDAIVLDNSTMTIDEQNKWLDNQVARKIAESR